MNREKLIHQLFIGKVSELIGFEKAAELLKESTDVINTLQTKAKEPKRVEEIVTLEESEMFSGKCIEDCSRFFRYKYSGVGGRLTYDFTMVGFDGQLSNQMEIGELIKMTKPFLTRKP